MKIACLGPFWGANLFLCCISPTACTGWLVAAQLNPGKTPLSLSVWTDLVLTCNSVTHRVCCVVNYLAQQYLTMVKLIIWCFILKLINAREECGRASLDSDSNQFAITGDDSVDVTAPWLAAIGYFRNSSEGYEKFVVACSGVVLSSNIISTAAHCFDNAQETLHTSWGWSDPPGPGLGRRHQWDSWPANHRGYSEQS